MFNSLYLRRGRGRRGGSGSGRGRGRRVRSRIRRGEEGFEEVASEDGEEEEESEVLVGQEHAHA